jgi:hypothetical protein
MYVNASSTKEIVKVIETPLRWFTHVKTIIPVRRVKNESLKTRSVMCVFPCGRRKAATEREKSIERRRQVTTTSSEIRWLELGDLPRLAKTASTKESSPTAVPAKKIAFS